jgi:ubiquinone/menaquinone biosynthesis C-methylase UbiE
MMPPSSPDDLSPIFYDPDFYDSYHAGKQFYFARQSDQLFWLDIAQTYGDPILELACGTGRITTFLAEQGLNVTGIDQSDAMLSAARKKSSAVQWINADIRNFALARKFPLILIPYFSLQHLLALEEVEACFHCVKQHLQPNGRFVIEVMHPSPNYLSQLSHASQLRLADCIFEDPIGRGFVSTSLKNWRCSSDTTALRWSTNLATMTTHLSRQMQRT